MSVFWRFSNQPLPEQYVSAATYPRRTASHAVITERAERGEPCLFSQPHINMYHRRTASNVVMFKSGLVEAIGTLVSPKDGLTLTSNELMCEKVSVFIFGEESSYRAC
jgi:hypothetical protein